MSQNASNALTDDARTKVSEILNHALADEFALSSVARDYHWHVTGPQHRNLNELFDVQYHELDRWIGRLGERARALHVSARTGWTDLIQAPRISPARGADLNAACMLAELLTLHDSLAIQLTSDAAVCPEPGLTGLLRELVEYHETSAWMLGELLEDRELAQA